MTSFDAPPAPPSGSDPATPDEPAAPARRGLSGVQIGILVVAFCFLAGAVGFVVGERKEADPLNATDVGFMQDMAYHHEQAVQMSLLLLDKEGIDRTLRSFAQEIIIDQRFEQGVYNATLDRFGHPVAVEDTVMGWMGEAVPAEDMPGLATEEQMDALREAEGDEAAALWIAMMSEHHLAGLHMADYAARYGSDRATVNMAEATVKNQRSEIIDLARYRETAGLPIPEGFTDPREDQRLDPIAFTEHDHDETTTTGD